MSKENKKKKSTIFCFIVFAIVVLICVLPIIAVCVNDSIAKNVMKDVKGKNLPENTTYVESFSAAGKLQGNGNGMQYLGGIVIKSDLSVDELKEYYKQYANEDWEFIVEKQEGQRVLASEHKDINIKAEITSNNFYVVYTWGSSDSIFAFFDIRGN